RADRRPGRRNVSGAHPRARHARPGLRLPAPPVHASAPRRHATHRAFGRARLPAGAARGRGAAGASRLRPLRRTRGTRDARECSRPYGRTGGCMRTVAVLLLLVLSSCASMAPTAPDLILYNANVWTVDDAQPTAEAVAIRGDRIVAVGSNAAVRALEGSTT